MQKSQVFLPLSVNGSRFFCPGKSMTPRGLECRAAPATEKDTEETGSWGPSAALTAGHQVLPGRGNGQYTFVSTTDN